jgi:hypothetical protein
MGICNVVEPANVSRLSHEDDVLESAICRYALAQLLSAVFCSFTQSKGLRDSGCS